jgi:DNA-directed RNA polymerase specialized sigma24 family protein
MAEHRPHFLMPIDWAILMRDHYPSACRVIERLMPRSLQATYAPEDFVGDAIVQLMAHPERFTVNVPATLIILIAKRRMIDAARSPRNRSMRLEVDMINRHSPAVLENEAAELLELMLGRARNSIARNVVHLRSCGHSLPEISQLTGLGLRKLQRFWKEFAEANQPL